MRDQIIATLINAVIRIHNTIAIGSFDVYIKEELKKCEQELYAVIKTLQS